MHDVRVHPNQVALADAAAGYFAIAARESILKHGRFSVALSGGGTPKAMYQRLAQAPQWRDEVDWSRAHFFWGDERFVPHDSIESNYRMAREALLEHVPVPDENIHPVPTELADAAQAAQAYERELRSFFDNDDKRRAATPGAAPSFDLMLLGMGTDGHTASLFPNEPQLHEMRRWVVAAHPRSQPTARVTITFPVINAAARLLALVAGPEKAAALRDAITSHRSPDELPIRGVKPVHGAIVWLVDRAAAAHLPDQA